MFIKRLEADRFRMSKIDDRMRRELEMEVRLQEEQRGTCRNALRCKWNKTHLDNAEILRHSIKTHTRILRNLRRTLESGYVPVYDETDNVKRAA